MGFDYIAIMMLIILSIILNATVVFVLAYHFKKLKSRDFILLSLAIADLIQSLFGFPYLITDYDNPLDQLATPACIFSAFTVTVTAVTAICHIVSLSVMFFLFLSYPFFAEKMESPMQVLLVFVLPCWMYGLLWGLFPLFGWSSYGKETAKGYRCGINMQEHNFNVLSYNIALLFGACVFPVLVTFICYIRVTLIIKSLGGSAAQQNGSHSTMNEETRRQEYSMFVMSLIMFAAFILAWFPYASFVLITAFKYTPTQTMFDVAAILAKTSSFYNPLIYAFAYKEFRHKVCHIWKRFTNRNLANVI